MDESPQHDESGAIGARAWLVAPAMLAALLVGVLLGRHIPAEAVDPSAIPKPGPPSKAADSEQVTLEIDFDNGTTFRFATLPWREGMTALDLLHQVRQRRPGLTFEQLGQGEAAFVESIAGVANEGAERRNWLIRINGEHAQVGAGVLQLEPSDTVLWVFAHYQ